MGQPLGPHITRYAMYARLKGVELPYRSGRVLAISHSDPLCKVMGITPTELVKADYPQHNMLDLGFESDSFDIVMSDQVLEHVEGDPQQAINECHRLLRCGGIAIHTTCFINPIHAHPKDFWRFTPEALALLHKGFSRVIEYAGWGNFEVWDYIRCGMRYQGIPHTKWHPLHKLATRNDLEWPITTWVVAVK